MHAEKTRKMHKRRDTLLTALLVFIVTFTVSRFHEVEATSTSAITQVSLDTLEITIDSPTTRATTADSTAQSDATATSLDSTATSMLDTVSSQAETTAKFSEATSDSMKSTGQSQDETTAKLSEATADSMTNTGKSQDETTVTIQETTTDSMTNTGKSDDETTVAIQETTTDSMTNTGKSQDETTAKISEATTDSMTNTGKSDDETTVKIPEATTDSMTNTGKSQDETTAKISEPTTDFMTNTGKSQDETTAKISEPTTDFMTNTGKSQDETTAQMPEVTADSKTNTGKSQDETTVKISEATADSMTNTGKSQDETTVTISEATTDSVTNTVPSKEETTVKLPETTTDSMTNTGKSQDETTSTAATSVLPNTGTGLTKLETTATYSEATTITKSNTGPSQEGTTAATTIQPTATPTQQGTTAATSDTATGSRTTPTQQGTTATTSDTATGTTPKQQGTTATTSDTATGTTPEQQGTTATTSDTATESMSGTSTTQQQVTTAAFTTSNESSIPGFNETLNLTTTGQTTTQSTTARRTTTLPPFQQPPNFAAAPPFKMNFTIAFVKTWTIDLANSSSPGYSSFKSAVDHEINTAFAGCPGYLPFTANVLRFSNDSEAISLPAASLMNSEGLPTLQATDNEVVYAAYQTSYVSKELLDNGVATYNHIETITEAMLRNATIVTIDGSVSVVPDSVNGTAAKAKTSITTLKEAPCKAIGTYVCSVCYPCINNSATDIFCEATCKDENKICTVNGSSSTGCNCKKKYLPVGDGCVHENVVIGATTGVVGAVLLGLVIAVCILCCKLDKTEDYKPLDSPIHTPGLTTSVQAIDEAVEGRTTKSGEGESLELLSFATFINQSPNENAESNVAAPKIPTRATGLASYDAYRSPGDDRSPYQPQHSANTYSELKDEDLPEEITSSQVFVSFVPRLEAVDSKTQFAIKRPTTTLQPSSTVKMPAQNDYYP